MVVDTTTTEVTTTNNSDQVTSVVGDYADVYTTVSCPVLGVINDNVTCEVNYGNQGNIVATGGNVVLDLDINLDFVSLT